MLAPPLKPGQILDKNSEYAKKWPGRPALFKLKDNLILAISGTAALPSDGSTSQRLLCLAAGSTIGTYYRGPAAAWSSQAVLVGKRLNLWLS